MEAQQCAELTSTNRPCGLTVSAKANIESNARSRATIRAQVTRYAIDAAVVVAAERHILHDAQR